MASQCRSCQAEVQWTKINGKPHPLDPGDVDIKPGHIVANPATGAGRFLHTAELEMAAGWVAKGAVVRRSHYATCPDADSWRNRAPAEDA